MCGRPNVTDGLAHILRTMRSVHPLVINLLAGFGFAVLVSKVLGWVTDVGREVQLLAFAFAFAGAFIVLAISSQRSSSHR